MSESHTGASALLDVTGIARNLSGDLEGENENLLRKIHGQCLSMERRMSSMQGALDALNKVAAETNCRIEQLFLRLPTGITRAGSSGKDSSGKESEVAAEQALICKYFSTEFVQRVVSFNIPLSVFNRYEKLGRGCKQDFPLLFLGAMLYAEGNSEESKVDFVREMRALRENNRTEILRNLVHNVAKRAEKDAERGLMNVEMSQNSSALTADQYGDGPMRRQLSSVHAASPVQNVLWLAPGFFNNSHLIMKNSEYVSNATPPASATKKRRTSNVSEKTKDDLALMVVRQVRIFVNEFVNKGRHFARKVLAAEFCFALVPLKRNDEDVEFSFMMHPERGSFECSSYRPEEMEWSLIPLSSVQTTAVNAEKCAAENDRLYKTLLETGKECGMLWVAQYAVLVEGPGKEKELRQIRRLVDLIEVSLKFCIAYFQSRDREHFLRSSRHSFILLFCIGLALRTLAQISYDPETGKRRLSVPTSKVWALLSYLFAGHDVLTRVFESSVLNMKRERFEELNAVEDYEMSEGRNDSADEAAIGDLTDIVENEDDGVVSIPDI
jgi:hypothetical protein